MITISTVLPNGDIPRISVDFSHEKAYKVQIPLASKISLAMAILQQLENPEAPVVWRFSEAEYASLIANGTNLTFDGV